MIVFGGGGIFGGGGGGVSGSGATGRLALWSSASALTSDTGLTYSGTGTGTVLRIGSTDIGLSRSTAWSGGGTPGIAFGNGTAASESQWISASGGVFRGAGVSNSHLQAGTAGTAYLVVHTDGTVRVNSGIKANASGAFGFSATSDPATSDTILTRRAAATLQLGAADSATPVAQTLAFQGSRGGTDTNVAGADATIQGSLGTGTAASGKIVFKVGTPTTSGTDQHVPAPVLTLQDTGTGGPSAPQALFENGSVPLPSISFRNAPGYGFSIYPGTAELTATASIFNWYTGAGYMAQMSAGSYWFMLGGGMHLSWGTIGGSPSVGIASLGTASLRVTDGSTGYGALTTSQYRLSALNTAPANATDTGTLGEIRIAADYIYICTATNTWVRAALVTWP